MILPIRDFEAAHYECVGFVICKQCYEEKLAPPIQILYSLVIVRTTLEALEIARMKICGNCSKPIKFSPKAVLAISEANNVTTYSLVRSACNTHSTETPTVNYANIEILRSAMGSLMGAARTYLQRMLRTHSQNPLIFNLVFLARHACRSEFFNNEPQPIPIAPAVVINEVRDNTINAQINAQINSQINSQIKHNAEQTQTKN